ELGHNILGTEADLSQVPRNDIAEFIHKNYQTHEIVIGITGNYTIRKVTALAARTLGKVPETSGHRHRIPPQQREVSQPRIEKPINQTHYLMGGTSYSVHHPNKVGLLLLNNLLGGMGMTSKLNLVVREKHGIAYTIESNYTPLSDTGIFHIYLGTDAEKTEKALRLVNNELR